MTHIKELLSPYMDKELPAEQMRQVEGHLPLCRDCSRHYQELKAASKLIQSLPEAALPAQFTRQLQNPIEKYVGQSGWNWNPFAPIRMVSVAACGLAAWAVVLLMAPSPENSLPPSKKTLAVIQGLSENAVSGTVSSQRIAAPKASAPAAAQTFAESGLRLRETGVPMPKFLARAREGIGAG